MTQRPIYRSVFSAAEIVLGLALVAFGTYPLLVEPECSSTEIVADCMGWGDIGLMMFLLPGIFVVSIGCISYFWIESSLPVLQATLFGVLSVYFLWLFGML